MEIHVKNLKSKIVTDNPKLLKALIDLYSFKNKGYEFSSAYKKGMWDGSTKFISNSGYFRTGLLESILDNLKKIDCIPDIIYEDTDNLKVSDYLIKGFSLYNYQEDLIKKALKEKRGIIKSPTGSGKTLIMASLLKSLEGYKGVILFNAKQLLRQSYEFFTNSCGLSNIGLCFGDGYVHGDIMLCTIQSIQNILDTHLEESQFLMVDECHEFANGKTTLPAIQSFPNAIFRYGFTATVPRDPIPRNNLIGAFGPIIEKFTTSDLVEEGKLTKPIIQLINRDYTANSRDQNMTYQEVYDEYIVNNASRNNMINDIVFAIREQKTDAKILILTKSLDHGRLLKDLIDDPCYFLEGCNSLGERYDTINKFREDEGVSVLIGTKILQTGVNIEEITHFINARGMKSEIATLQALGRALRKHDTKHKVFIYDFLDKEKYLDNHSSSRRKHYKREGHQIEII